MVAAALGIEVHSGIEEIKKISVQTEIPEFKPKNVQLPKKGLYKQRKHISKKKLKR